MDEATERTLALMQTRISLLERKIAFLLQATNLRYTEAISPQLEPIAELLRQGRRREAIDAYSEVTGAGLAAAQAAVAELELLLK